jgi:hypothetical protein
MASGKLCLSREGGVTAVTEGKSGTDIKRRSRAGVCPIVIKRKTI